MPFPLILCSPRRYERVAGEYAVLSFAPVPPGGDSQFRVNVLSGDATRDGAVNALDLADVRRRLSRGPGDGVAGHGAYSVFADMTADAVINALDLAAVRQRLNRRISNLPEPASLFA